MPAGARAMRSGAALLLVAVLAACASTTPPRSAASGPPRAIANSPGATGSFGTVTPVPPARSDRGNPPFYEVFGRRYHVLPTSAGYVQRGVASWYGRDFHGLSTSSGETYNMHAMTAAHTTLPLPTWVEVTNLANGKRVLVKVNDRGPFVDNRLIDLSYAAATALDMVQTGTTRVEVRAVAPPLEEFRATTTVAATPAPLTTPVGVAPLPLEQMFVQIGAFSQPENAERLVARLRASGFANPTVVSQPDKRRMLHRVRLGPIASAGEFDQLSARLRAIGVSGSQLVVDRAP